MIKRVKGGQTKRGREEERQVQWFCSSVFEEFLLRICEGWNED